MQLERFHNGIHFILIPSELVTFFLEKRIERALTIAEKLKMGIHSPKLMLK